MFCILYVNYYQPEFPRNSVISSVGSVIGGIGKGLSGINVFVKQSVKEIKAKLLSKIRKTYLNIKKIKCLSHTLRDFINYFSDNLQTTGYHS